MRSSDSKPKPPANVGFTTPPSVLPESRQISWIFDHQILAERQNSRKVACAKNAIS
jgi:hypothetical protein